MPRFARTFAVLSLVACTGGPASPSAMATAAPAPRATAPKPFVVGTPRVQTTASSPPEPVRVLDAGADAAPGPASNAPSVRASKWVCEDQECEGMPTIAYDYLPAVTESGDIVALVEERDGWAHVARIGVHLVSVGGETAFLPTVTGDRTATFAEYSRKAAAHRSAIEAVNAALAKHPFRPLYPLAVAGEEVLVKGAWVTAAPGLSGKLRTSFAYGNVRVVVTEPRDEAHSEIRFESLVILVDGRLVATKTGPDLPDRLGCSARRMRFEGVRVESKALALTYTNGTTSHACDGKTEPQVHHVVRW
jgi:hypothetical protein